MQQSCNCFCFLVSLYKIMKENRTHPMHNRADYLGITGSILCIIHCLITPVLAVGSTALHGHQELLLGGVISFDYIFIAVNGAAVFFATRSHNWPALKAFLWFSFALFTTSLLLEERSTFFQVLSYVGSGLLIIGHIYNLYKCRMTSVNN
jgi:hypothetical protein